MQEITKRLQCQSLIKLSCFLSRRSLDLISQKFCIEEDADLEDILQLFDLLLKYEHYATASALIEHYLKIYEDAYQLYYYLAQAQHKDGYYKKANENYIRALLLHPSLELVNR